MLLLPTRVISLKCGESNDITGNLVERSVSEKHPGIGGQPPTHSTSVPTMATLLKIYLRVCTFNVQEPNPSHYTCLQFFHFDELNMVLFQCYIC